MTYVIHQITNTYLIDFIFKNIEKKIYRQIDVIPHVSVNPLGPISVYKKKLVLGYFSVTLCSYYFCNFPEKKILDPNGPYISTFQIILRNVCLSVISVCRRRRCRRCRCSRRRRTL